jgi:hypothetical protein
MEGEQFPLRPSPEEAAALYEKLSPDQKTRVMQSFTSDLASAFRWITSQPLPEEERLNKLQGISELQHNATSQLLVYLNGRRQLYADRDFIIALIKVGKAYDLAGPVQNALFSALELYR